MDVRQAKIIGNNIKYQMDVLGKEGNSQDVQKMALHELATRVNHFIRENVPQDPLGGNLKPVTDDDSIAVKTGRQLLKEGSDVSDGDDIVGHKQAHITILAGKVFKLIQEQTDGMEGAESIDSKKVIHDKIGRAHV